MKYLAIFGFILGLLFIAFIPDQDDFAFIVSGFALSFSCYFLLVSRTDFDLKSMLLLGMSIRFICIFALPNLSDDIYRFIWDGHLLHLGESPFAYLPSEYVRTTEIGIFAELFPMLNSPEYYSIYPPFAQFIFYVSTFTWMNSAIVMKVLLFVAECITVAYGLKLLRLRKQDPRLILWYALNPLIIIEVMVNIHFEGFMVCFFVLFLYFLYHKQINKAAVFIALSISAKLVPLLFLPFFLFQWVFRKSFLFYLKLGVILLFFFFPILFQLSGFGDSLDLYFRKFEFNASIYYILRELGELWKGYNMIGKVGPAMAIIVFTSVFYLAYRNRDFLVFCQWALLIFLLLSTTVHPWYLSLGIIISVFTGSRFFVLWSFLIVLSYAKYGLGDQLYYCFVGIEYIVLAGYIYYETRHKVSFTHEISRET